MYGVCVRVFLCECLFAVHLKEWVLFFHFWVPGVVIKYPYWLSYFDPHSLHF